MGKIALTRQYSAITDFVIFAAVVAHNIECIVYTHIYQYQRLSYDKLVGVKN